MSWVLTLCFCWKDPSRKDLCEGEEVTMERVTPLIREMNLISSQKAALWWIKHMQHWHVLHFVRGGATHRKRSRAPWVFFVGCTDRMQKPSKHGAAESWGKQMWLWHSGFPLSTFLSFQVEERSEDFGHRSQISAAPRSDITYTEWYACSSAARRLFHATGVGRKPQRFTVTTQPIMCCIKAWLGYEGKISITFASSYTN